MEATGNIFFSIFKGISLSLIHILGPADYGSSLLSRVANRDIQIKPFTNFIKKNQDVYKRQILDLLERPYPVHSGLLAPQEIRTELIKKEEI